MQRQRFVATGLPILTLRLALSCLVVAAFASTVRAQGSAPYPSSAPSGAPTNPNQEDPIQEGRDGMRILGTITVAPGAPRATVIEDDESATPLSADRMAWSEAAKNAYAARQYGEARALFRRAAQGGDAEAQMMLGQMAERGQGGPQDLDEALGWYAAAARKGVKGAAQKVASLTDTLRRQAAESVASAPPGGESAGSKSTTPARRSATNSAAPEKKPSPRPQARAQSPAATPPRGQRAESLTPRPAPEVTAESEPLADVPAQSSASQPPGKQQPSLQQQTQQERAPPAPPQQQARAADPKPPAPRASVPEWPVAPNRGAQPPPSAAASSDKSSERSSGPGDQRARASPPDRAEASRGNSGGEQQASLPESLEPPNLSEPIAPLPKRAAPPLSADVKSKLDQARALESGKGAAKNEAKAIELYRAIADQSAEAAFDLGWRYAAGRGVKRDDKEAVRYYRMAADKGYAPAQNNLGGLIADGRGVNRDEEEAVDWFRRAALQDFAPAQVNLALMYGKGRGIPQSDANAMAWYSRAAKTGYGPATASLAMMYSEGRGVPQDQKTADFLMESAKGASPASALVSVEP